MRITTIYTLILSATIIITFGCGESSDVVFEQITPSDSVYQLDDLKVLGIKKGKKYNVEGLDKATDAIFAFYKKPGA